MPTIQRLLTDETGQSLVTAINNIVAAVKPNATEIQMGANDTTTVAEAINSTNQALSALTTKTTISDCNTYNAEGIGRIVESTANRPFNNGVLANIIYSLSEYGYLAQLAISVSNQAFAYRTSNTGGSTWTAWKEVARSNDVTVTAYSGTTIVESSVKMIGDLVSGTVVFKMNASATTWKNAFQVSPAPKSSETYAPCILTNNGQYLGMCKFYNNTAVQIYPLNAITASSQTVSVTFSYAVN